VRTSIHSELVEMLHGYEDELSHARYDAEQQVAAARHAEAQLKAVVGGAVERAQRASDEQDACRVAARALTAELPMMDAKLDQLAHHLAASQADEADLQQQLSTCKMEMARTVRQSAADEKARAAEAEKARGALAAKLAEAASVVNTLTSRLATTNVDLTRARKEHGEMGAALETAKWREAAMAKERDESRAMASSSDARLAKQLAEARRVAARTEEEVRAVTRLQPDAMRCAQPDATALRRT
jgi:chromosome segregation ATPase